MEFSTAQQILSLLADGIDPETGEMLPQDSVCNQPEVIRALHVALDCLSMQKRKKTNKKWINQGKFGLQTKKKNWFKCLKGEKAI